MYKLEEILSVAAEQPGPSSQIADETPVIVSMGYISDRSTLLVAMVCRDTLGRSNLSLIYGKCDWCVSGEDPSFLVDKLNLEAHKQVATVAISPSGRWLACVLENGSVEVVPTKMVLGEVWTEKVDPGLTPLFPESEFTHISLRVRDDCLCLPTCALWYETKHSKRPMLIYSNKGGDILFVDLLIRKLSVSLQAPQSIHKIEIVNDATVSDTYLLATGFAASQWMVPLELGELSLRETLSNIIPSELRELDTSGHVATVLSHGTNCVGLLRTDVNLFQIYNTVAMKNPAVEIKLLPNTWTLQYSDCMTFSLRNLTEIVAAFHFSTPVELPESLSEKLVSCPGSLESDSRFVGFVPIRFERSNGQLPICFLVDEHSVNVLKPKCTGGELFIDCLNPSGDLILCRSLCDALRMDFAATAVEVGTQILEGKENFSPKVALKLMDRANLPWAETSRLFYEHGHGKFILPYLSKWITTSSHKVADASRRDMCSMAFKLYIQLVLESSDYERNVHCHEFKEFLYHNQHYPAETCLIELIDAGLYDCAVIILKLHDLEAVAVRRLLQLKTWDNTDAFVELLTFSNNASLFVNDQQLASDFLTRLRKFARNCTNPIHLRAVLNLTNPHRNEVQQLLTAKDTGTEEVLSKYVLSHLADLYLSCLLHYLYAQPEVTTDDSAANQPTENLFNVLSRPMACGSSHCILVANDALYAWGRTKPAILGPNAPYDPAKSSMPIRVDLSFSSHRVCSVVCGNEHTLLLLKNGQIYGFGQNRYGQLGLGHRHLCSQPNKIETLANNNEFIKYLNAGNYHNAAIGRSGCVYLWGWGLHGQLGLHKRKLDDAIVPTINTYFADQQISIEQVVCGHAHTIFLTTDAQLYSCGNGTYGQLGLGTTTKMTLPTKIEADFGPGRITLMACGLFHTVILTSRKRLFSWGSTPQALKFKALLQKRKATNSAAEKDMSYSEGVGALEGKHLRSSELELSVGLSSPSEEIIQIECGFHHTAMLTASGQLYTWGKSLEFQLGHGDKKERHAPTLVSAVGDGKQWRHIACGFDHMLAIDRDGSVWGWGRNDYCQLGFESVPKSDQKKLSGKVLTIQRPNKSQRTITLPQDNRLFVSKPSRLLGLTASLPDTLGNTSVLPLYDQGSVFSALRTFAGLIDPLRISTVCQQVRVPEMGAFVWLSSGMVPAALKMHSDALKLRPSLTNNNASSILGFYQPFILNMTDWDEKRAALLCLVQEFPFTNSQVENFLDANLDHWATLLADVLRCSPEALGAFSNAFKLRVLRAALARNKQQDLNSNNQSHVIISQEALENGQRLCYHFGACGHTLSESKLQAQLGRLQTKHQLNSALPRTAALTQDLYNFDEMQGGYESIKTHLCPDCLGQFLSNLAEQLEC